MGITAGRSRAARRPATTRAQLHNMYQPQQLAAASDRGWPAASATTMPSALRCCRRRHSMSPCCYATGFSMTADSGDRHTDCHSAAGRGCEAGHRLYVYK